MRLSLAYLLIFCCQLAFSQDEALNKAAWEELRSEVEFRKSGKNDSKENQGGSKEGTRKGDGERDRSSSEPSGGGSYINLGPLFQIIIVILFIVFIVLLLYALLKGANLRNKPSEIQSAEDLDLNAIDKDLNRSDLEKWLAEALAERNYQLAVRIYFLIALKGLEQMRLIRWEKEKTNWDYIQELKDHHLQKPFTDLVYEYDRLWYGEKNYGDEVMQQKMEDFKVFKKLLGGEE